VNTDILLTLLSVVWGLLLTLIGIVMANYPPNVPWKKWLYHGLFSLLFVAVVITTLIQSSRTQREQSAERARHEREQSTERAQHASEQGRLEGKLSFISDVMSKSSCPGIAEIGAVVKQEVATQIYERLRKPISEGNLDGLSSDILVAMVPKVTGHLRTSFREWSAIDSPLLFSKYLETEHRASEKDPAVLEQKKKEWDHKIELEREDYRSNLKQALSDADLLRKALLDRLPKDAQTAADNEEAAAFARALTDVPSMMPLPMQFGSPPAISKAADYLDALAKRVALAKSLRGTN
jgi:hypothetical protein